MTDGARLSLGALAGRRVHAVLGIGDPEAFLRQLRSMGAEASATIFEDHHSFDAQEITRLAHQVTPDTLVVCTLKDAVKLRQGWPREGPTLWYVSQRVVVERGVGGIERLLDDLLHAARRRSEPRAG